MLSSSAASAQEGSEAEESAEPAPEEAPDTGLEEEPELTDDDDDAREEVEAADEDGAPEPDPTDEAPVEPIVEDEAPPVDPTAIDNDASAEEQPDYFGGYEPLSAPMSTETEMPRKPPYMGPFRGGAFRVGLGIGGGGYGDQTYFILGGGLGYFLVNGLEVHFDTDFWLIGDPFIATPTLGARYVMWFVPKVHPYLGTFYRRYVVGSGYLDADSVGARGGVYLMTGRSSYFGLGIVYEHMLQDHLFTETDFYYPEITFAFAF